MVNDVYPIWQLLLGSNSLRERQTVICNLLPNFFIINKAYVLFLGLVLLGGMLFVYYLPWYSTCEISMIKFRQY